MTRTVRFASAVKTHFRRLESAVASGDDATVEAEHKALVSRDRQGRPEGRDAPNTGARKKARAARIRSGAAPAASPAQPAPAEEAPAQADEAPAEADEQQG